MDRLIVRDGVGPKPFEGVGDIVKLAEFEASRSESEDGLDVRAAFAVDLFLRMVLVGVEGEFSLGVELFADNGPEESEVGDHMSRCE